MDWAVKIQWMDDCEGEIRKEIFGVEELTQEYMHEINDVFMHMLYDQSRKVSA